MPKLKVLGGKDVLKIFSNVGFEKVSQKGGHVKLKRMTESNTAQVLIFPMHTELDKGTLKAIIHQATKYISEEELRKYFYE